MGARRDSLSSHSVFNRRGKLQDRLETSHGYIGNASNFITSEIMSLTITKLKYVDEYMVGLVNIILLSIDSYQ